MYTLGSFAREPRYEEPRLGVSGVGGIDSEDKLGDNRLYALFEGRKMPAPRVDVVKYLILYS